MVYRAIIGPNKTVIARFKEKMVVELKLKDLGPLTHILGVEVKRDRSNMVLTLHLGSYVRYVFGTV